MDGKKRRWQRRGRSYGSFKEGKEEIVGEQVWEYAKQNRKGILFKVFILVQ